MIRFHSLWIAGVLAAGSLTAVAASEEGVAPLYVPELAGDRWQCGGSAVAHRTAGYVYGLRTEMYPSADYREVNLIDTDRDGTIDSEVTEYPAGDLHGNAVIAWF